MSGTLPHATRLSMAALQGETSLVRELTAGGLSGANAATFDELTRLIQLSQGRHSFSLVECNSPVLRDRVLMNLVLVFPGLHVVSIGPETYSILDFVVHEIGQSSPSAVVIVGIETLLQRVERYEPALARLNYSRDGWREELRCPTIFWLPEFAAIALTRDCPDLLRMITTRFRFEADGESAATVPNLESPLREPRTESMASGNEAAAASDWSTVEMDSAIRAGFEAFEAELEKGDLSQAESRLRDLQRQVGLGLDRHTLAEDGWERLIFFEKQALWAQRRHDSRREADSWEMAYRIAKDRLERDKSVSSVRHTAWIARSWATNRVASGDTQQGLSLALDSLNFLETAAASLPCEPRLSRDLATTLDLVARIQVVLGHSDAAWHALKQAYEIRSGLVSMAPDRADYQRDLSVSYDRMGDLHRSLGDGHAARDAYEMSLDIDRKLAAAEPDRAEYRQDLAISLNKMGDLYRSLGDGPAARDAFQESLEIDQKLVAAEPDRVDYQRDLSVSYDRMGDLYRDLGDIPAALDAFQKSLSIRQRLAIADRNRADYQRDLSVSYDHLGGLYRALSDGPAAREAFQKSLDITQELVATEPDRADYLLDLSIALNKMGDLYRVLGDDLAARDTFQKSLAIRQKLAAAEPDRADYQSGLSVSYDRIGSVYRALGDGHAAHEAFQKSLAITKALATAEPDRADYQRALAVSFIKVGELDYALGNRRAARDAFETSLSMYEQLVAAEPDRTDYQIDLVSSLYWISQVVDEPATPLQRALRILHDLQQTGRLAPAQQWKLEELRQMLRRTAAKTV